ncbi:hypothetical protein LB553_11710 [Mesorhizobium sp. CA8]|nr:hypothetical protein [Mesorhizobium sp. CA8]
MQTILNIFFNAGCSQRMQRSVDSAVGPEIDWMRRRSGTRRTPGREPEPGSNILAVEDHQN